MEGSKLQVTSPPPTPPKPRHRKEPGYRSEVLGFDCTVEAPGNLFFPYLILGPQDFSVLPLPLPVNLELFQNRKLKNFLVPTGKAQGTGITA